MFRWLSRLGLRNASVLEHTIVQSAGSAGEAMAFGMSMTIPAIIILDFELRLTYILSLSLIGGVLGVLLMIPLRREFIVQQHGLLRYPEGTACAEVAQTLVDRGAGLY
jgi:uncharacterized oligopeptide transporter (OPT) family protein